MCLPGNGYPIGNGINLAASLTGGITTGILLLYMKRNNRKRERGEYDKYLEGVAPEDAHRLGNNHPGFRYKM
jgi:hypothetical protein